MKTLTRATMIAVLIGLWAGGASAAGGDDSVRVLQRELADYLTALEYPHGVVRTFCGSIPSDMLLRLGRRGVEEATWEVRARRRTAILSIVSPADSTPQWAFYTGDLDGFFAIVKGDATSGRLLCSETTEMFLLFSQLESVDLTGDNVPEITIKGFPYLGATIAMEIVSWDGVSCRFVTPREPASKYGIGATKLIGGDVRFHDVDGDGVPDVIVQVAQHGTIRKPSTYRAYRYDRAEEAFVEVPFSPEKPDSAGP